MNSGLCRGDRPSLRKLRLISKTRSRPPTMSRLRCSSGATGTDPHRGRCGASRRDARRRRGHCASSASRPGPRPVKNSRVAEISFERRTKVARLRPTHQVEVALTLADFRRQLTTGRAGLLRRRRHGLAEDGHRAHEDRDFAGLGATDLAGDSTQSARFRLRTISQSVSLSTFRSR